MCSMIPGKKLHASKVEDVLQPKIIKNTRIKCLHFAVPTMQAQRTAPVFVDEAEFVIYALGL